MADLKVAIAGAGGKMGGANIRALAAAAGVSVVSAFDRPGSAAVGKDAGESSGIEALGVLIGDDPEAALAVADAVIDFTAPAASVALAQRAAALGKIHIIGTTGCSVEDDAADRRRREGRRDHRQGRQFLARAQPAARPCAQGRGGTARL